MDLNSRNNASTKNKTPAKISDLTVVLCLPKHFIHVYIDIWFIMYKKRTESLLEWWNTAHKYSMADVETRCKKFYH